MFKQSTAKSLAREEEPLIISGLRGEDLPFKDKIKIVGSEEMMTYINPDELLEVTPDALRLRKRILNHNNREKAEKNNKR